MKDTNKLNPEIRFSGFTDDWEERKLREITSLITKGTTPKNKTGNGEINFIKVENIDSSSGEIKDYLKISIEEHEGYLKRSQLKENDILFSIAGTLGRTAVVNKRLLPANTNQALAILRTSEGDISYIITVLKGKAVSDFVRKNPTVGAQPNLSLEQVSNLEISYPSIDEQVKIGEFFSCIDNLITLHQRKLDKLKTLKKAMLEKMFPKNGESIPEIRFSGFTDDWEQRKLNEVSNIYDGTHQTPKYQDDGVMFLSVENIKTLTSNKFISREAFEDEFKIRPQRGDVLMTRIGDIGTANVVETDEDLAYYVSLALFKSEELNPYFLQASIYAPFVQDQIWERTLHIAFPKKINKNEIGQVPINVPTLEEQTKIGSFFKQLDDTITLHQRKLDKLKTIKKAMLEKMFI